MSTLIYIVTYLAIIVFVSAAVKRILHYITNPIHVRWELYPVPHEGKRASYGGSYLEDVDWWPKEREISKIGELKVMIPEMLFLKAVWENSQVTYKGRPIRITPDFSPETKKARRSIMRRVTLVPAGFPGYLKITWP